MKVKVCVSAEKIPDLVSWLTMRKTKFYASHCFLIINSEIFDAVGTGVRRTKLAPFLADHWVTDSIEFDAPCTEAEFNKWFQTVNNIPYSNRQWFGFIAPKFLMPLFKNGRKAAICTEFVLWFLTDIMKWAEPDDEFKTPQQVMEFVRTKLAR